MTWTEYQDAHIAPQVQRTAEILERQGKLDTYTLTELQDALVQAAWELRSKETAGSK